MQDQQDELLAQLKETVDQLRRENDQLRLALQGKQVELEAVRTQRRYSEVVIELANDAMFHGDVQGNFVACNQRAEELTGYSRQELLAMNMGQLFSAEERQRVPLRYDLLKAGKVVCNQRQLSRRDGSEVEIEMCSKMLADGTYHAVIRDISQDKEMEQARLDFLMQQRAMSEATFEAIVLTSNGNCVGINSNAVDLFGYSQEEMLGHPSTMVIAPEERQRVRDKIMAGYEKPYETVVLTKSGRRIPVEIRGREVVFRGRQLRVAAVRDITHQKQAEKDRQIIHKLEGIGTLAGGIAHDFNNILTGLFGNISLAKTHLPPGNAALGYLQQAENSLSRASSLTSRLLTFAKGGEPVTESVGLAELVKDVVSFDLAGSKVQLVLQADKGLWQAEADRGQLEQVFSNLAINASQAMADGGKLTITLSNYQHDGEEIVGLAAGPHIRAVVQDEGVGIHPSHLSRVFDPYFSTKQTGRGLGLAGVHSIITRHKGVISVSSKPGAGAVFSFYLPASERPVSDKPLSAGTGSPSLPSSSRVLVMDDDQHVCQIVSAMLERMQCQADTVANGKLALDCYQKALEAGKGYDLVILDLTIPGGWGGKETIGPLLEIDPAARVLVSSGYTEDPIMARYADYGFWAVLPKPYIFSQFASVVTATLQKGGEDVTSL